MRTRIIRVLFALMVAWIVAWQIEPYLYDAMESRINAAVQSVLKPKGIDYKTVVDNATAPFLLKLKFSLYIALVLIFPYIIIQIWGFVAPALKLSEQKPFKKLAPASAGLFLMGASFAYMAVPAMFKWLASYAEEFPGIAIYQEAGSQLILVSKMMLAFGVAFQLPLIVYGLGLAGVLTAETLVKYWRHGVTIIFLIAAIITPSADPMSTLMMALPLSLLFAGSVYAVKLMEKRRMREAGDEAEAQTAASSPIAILDPPATVVEQNGADLRGPLETDEETHEPNRTSG